MSLNDTPVYIPIEECFHLSPSTYVCPHEPKHEIENHKTYSNNNDRYNNKHMVDLHR